MIKTLDQLYVRELYALYGAETELCDGLPALLAAATHKDLVEALTTTLEQSRQRRHRLDLILTAAGHEGGPMPANPTNAMLLGAGELIAATPHPDIRDAGLIALLQQMSSCQLVAYNSVVLFAATLKLKSDAQAMRNAAIETKEMGELLAKLATRTINRAVTASSHVES